jgi:AcrR family transcriptional regulator
MPKPVKPRRSYDSQRRRQQAAQTRRDIEAAANKLFRERGYAGTSMPVIAAEAGVVVETIYRAFGSKAGLFKAVVEAALAGGPKRADIPPTDRRSGPLYRVLAGAADNDRELKAVIDGIAARRLHGLGNLAGQLADSGELRPELSVEEARDLIWTLCSSAVHDLLVRDRGWTSERYRDWLATALKRELLKEPA